MKYFFIKHDIEPEDKYISSESNMNLQLVLDKKKSPTTYFKGKNETDYISGMYGISKKAKDFFMSLNNPYIEFVSTTVYHIDTDEPMNIYLMKVNLELDCIDYEKSELFVLSDKNIRGIDKLVIKTNVEEEIFNIKNLLFSITISENIKNRMVDFGLRGFDYIPIEEFRF